MRLSQMQDVGGCRAVLDSQDAAYGVLKGISRNWEIITVDDYVARPRPSGYRALHVIVRRDEVPIEVQIRTRGQQTWADEVERLGGLTPFLLKDGEGPADMLEYTRILADFIADIDAGEPADAEVLARLTTLRSNLP